MSKTMAEADRKLLFNTLDRLREAGYTQYCIYCQIEEWREEAQGEYTVEFFQGIGVEPPSDAGMEMTVEPSPREVTSV